MNARIIKKNSGMAVEWECGCGAILTCMPEGQDRIEKCIRCGIGYAVSAECAVAIETVPIPPTPEQSDSKAKKSKR